MIRLVNANKSQLFVDLFTTIKKISESKTSSFYALLLICIT